MVTQRFNSNKDYRGDAETNRNYAFLGFIDLLTALSDELDKTDYTMIEIGSYMGESTMMFASTGLFSTIYSIDPLSGYEEFNEMHNYSWDFVKDEFNKNTKYFDNIVQLQDFSYNVVDKFEDNSIDFIYIDGNHSEESVRQDLELYLPKLKKNGIIAGHDYNDYSWPGLVNAVLGVIGKPDRIFLDTSWIKFYNNDEV